MISSFANKDERAKKKFYSNNDIKSYSESDRVIVSHLNAELNATYSMLLGAAQELLDRFSADHSMPNEFEIVARVIKSKDNFAGLKNRDRDSDKFFFWIPKRGKSGMFMGVNVIMALSQEPLKRYFHWIIDPNEGEKYRKDPFNLLQSDDVNDAGQKGEYGGAGFMILYPFFHELTHVSNLHIIVNQEVSRYIMKLFERSAQSKREVVVPKAFAPIGVFENTRDQNTLVLNTILQNRLLKYKLNLLYLPNKYVRYIIENEANIGGTLATMLVYFYYIFIIRNVIVVERTNEEKNYRAFYESIASILGKHNLGIEERYQLYERFLTFINEQVMTKLQTKDFIKNYLSAYENYFKSTLSNIFGENYVNSKMYNYTFGIYNVMYNFVKMISQAFGDSKTRQDIKGHDIISLLNKIIANDLAYYTYKYVKSQTNYYLKNIGGSTDSEQVRNSLLSYVTKLLTEFKPIAVLNKEGAETVTATYNTAMYEALKHMASDAVKDIKGLQAYSLGWKELSKDVISRWKNTCVKLDKIYNNLLYGDIIHARDDKYFDYEDWLKEIQKEIDEIKKIAAETMMIANFKYTNEIMELTKAISKYQDEKSKADKNKVPKELLEKINDLKKKVASSYVMFISNLDIDPIIKDAIVSALIEEDGKGNLILDTVLSKADNYERFIERVYTMLVTRLAEVNPVKAPQLIKKYIYILMRHPLFSTNYGRHQREDYSLANRTLHIIEDIEMYVESLLLCFDRLSEYIQDSINKINAGYALTEETLRQSANELSMDIIFNSKRLKQKDISLLALHNETVDNISMDVQRSSKFNVYYGIDHRIMKYLFYTNFTDFNIVFDDFIKVLDVVYAMSRSLFDIVPLSMASKHQATTLAAFAMAFGFNKDNYGDSPFGSGDMTGGHGPGGDPPGDDPDNDNGGDGEGPGGGGGGKDRDKDKEGPDGDGEGPNGSGKDRDKDKEDNDKDRGEGPKKGKNPVRVIDNETWEKIKRGEIVNIDIDQLKTRDTDEKLKYNPKDEEMDPDYIVKTIYDQNINNRISNIVSGLPEGIKLTYKGVTASVSSASYLLYKLILEKYAGFVNNNIYAVEGYLHAGFGSSASEQTYIEPTVVPSQVEASSDPSIMPVAAQIKKQFEPEYTKITADYVSIDVSGSMHGYINKAIQAGSNTYLKNTNLENEVKSLIIDISAHGIIDEEKLDEIFVNNDSLAAKRFESYINSVIAHFDKRKIELFAKLVYETFAFAFYMDPKNVLSKNIFRNANFASIVNNAEPTTTLVSITAISDSDNSIYPSITSLVDTANEVLIEKLTYGSAHLSGGNDHAFMVGQAWGEVLLKDIILALLRHYYRNNKSLQNQKIDVAVNMIHITDLYYPQSSHVAGFVDTILSLNNPAVLRNVIARTEYIDILNTSITHAHGVITDGSESTDVLNAVRTFNEKFVVQYELDPATNMLVIAFYNKNNEEQFMKFGIHFNNLGFFCYGEEYAIMEALQVDAGANTIYKVTKKIKNFLKSVSPDMADKIALYNAYRMMPKSIIAMDINEATVLKAAIAIVLLAFRAVISKKGSDKEFAFTEEDLKHITIQVERRRALIEKILKGKIFKKSIGVRSSSEGQYANATNNTDMYSATFQDFLSWIGDDSLRSAAHIVPDRLNYVTPEDSDIIEETTTEALKETLSADKSIATSTINIITGPIT